MKKKFHLLLLTNRDSDNVGDQIIEACDIALIKTVMKNLGISENEYKIDSRAASSVGTKYLQTKNPLLIAFGNRFMTGPMHKIIHGSDMVIFGGAPVFNYKYQMFYERTASTLELANQYQKPVIFSAIGIEHYEEENEKCQRLKAAINCGCVQQITTRDGIEELQKYKEDENILIDIVSDPAVFSAQTFRPFLAPPVSGTRKTIGIFVFRASGFTDNNIDFSKEDAVHLWKDLIAEIEAQEYDYRLLTSGHFGDEAFMDSLIREHGIPEEKCIFNMNSPEKLVSSISSFDAIVSCRLHPSIIAYSLDVPSVGLIWNPKVRHFYDCIGYSDRHMEVCGLTGKDILDKLQTIQTEEIQKDSDYLISVYRHLFYGIKKALRLEDMNQEPYNFDELSEHIPPYETVSGPENRRRLKRKFRRIYKTLNTRAEINAKLKKELKEVQEVSRSYTMTYYSWSKTASVKLRKDRENIITGKFLHNAPKTKEIQLPEPIANSGQEVFLPSPFTHSKKEFAGWRVRFLIGDTWFWYLCDGSYCDKKIYDKQTNAKVKVFKSGEKIPKLPFICVDTVTAEAVWHTNRQSAPTQKEG
ncbi:MAG: polysaccharide pyruvyl transferase family protein [Lachnospiraceae bacterium]|nr:polysaccharide pyruvyl transferase family protein [Lachnospiraceae bacterium]